jgi:hypothetical protein
MTDSLSQQLGKQRRPLSPSIHYADRPSDNPQSTEPRKPSIAEVETISYNPSVENLDVNQQENRTNFQNSQKGGITDKNKLLETLKIRERGASGEFYSVIWFVFLENSSKNSD